MILPASGNKEVNQINPIQNKDNNSIDYAKKIVLANKGESGYSPIFDLDENGIITLDEFNRYCEENGVSSEDKLQLMMTMQCAKNTQAMTEEKEENNSQIYARKGDEKYVEEMDENRDSVVTHYEYMKYCQDYANSNEDTKEKTKDVKPEYKQALESYLNNDSEIEAEIKVEIQV